MMTQKAAVPVEVRVSGAAVEAAAELVLDQSRGEVNEKKHYLLQLSQYWFRLTRDAGVLDTVFSRSQNSTNIPPSFLNIQR